MATAVQTRQAPRHLSRSRNRHERAGRLFFFALLAAGLVLRILLARTTWRQPDSDQAMAMIMALRASQGHLSLVFWGGNYGGALLSWIEAPIIAVFGLSFWLFWTVNTLVTLIGVLLLWAIARRMLPPIAAAATAASFWYFPGIWMFFSSREFSFYLPSIVFALATCLFLLRWHERRRMADLYAMGLCAGVSIWEDPLVASIVVPALVAFVIMERRRPAVVARAAAAAIVGVSPWLAYFAYHGRSAFKLQPTVESRTVALRHALSQVLPTTLFGGAKRFGVIWMNPTLSPTLSHVVAGVAVALAVGVVVASIPLRRGDLAVAAVSVLAWPLVLALAHVPLSAVTFRYGFVVVPPLLLLAGYVASLLRAGVILSGLTLLSGTYVSVTDTADLASAPVCNASVQAVDSWLIQHGRTAVWGSYWVTADMTFCAYPHLVAGEVAPARDALARAAAAAAPRSTYVVFVDNQLDKEISAWVAAHHVAVQKAEIDGFDIYAFDRALQPWQMQLQGGAF